MATIKCTIDRSSYYEMYIEYSYTQSAAKKKTTLTHALKLKQLTDSYDFSGTMDVTYYIAGTAFSYNGNININDKGNTGYTITIGTSHTTEISHNSTTGDGSFTVSCSGSCNSGGYGPGNISLSSTTIKLPRLPLYDLTISKGTGSKITVKRTSSGGSGATGNLSAGSNKLYYGDKLKITFKADTNYGISKHTVNNKSFTSGNTHTVTNDVSVVATATPLKSTIGATNADIESVSTITITRYNTSYKHTIKYSFGSLSGYIDKDGSISNSAIKLSAVSIPFMVPESFYTQIPKKSYGTCTLTCTTYNGDTSLGSTTCTMKLTADKEECKPEVSGVVVDTNETTIALTSDSNTLIRYKSTAKCTITATAKNSASISSRIINNKEAQQDADGKYSVEFGEVDAEKFVFKATDSREYPNSVTIKPYIVPYIQLTCNPTIKRETPTGTSIVMSVKGNIYNGVFGNAENAAKNNLILQYRYKVAGETYGDWQTVSPTSIVYGTSSYAADGILLGSEFDYRTNYVFQIRATDGAIVNGITYSLSTITQDIGVPRGLPVFDWGEDDFNFNVPLTLTVDKVGQDTKVYDLTGLSIAYSSCYNLDVTASAGNGYRVRKTYAMLIGTTLRIYISVYRESAPSVGNITNETVATLTVKHDGKIKAIYNTSGVSSGLGGVATFTTTNLSAVDANNISIPIRLCATTTTNQSYGCYLQMPVLLNLNTFTKEVVESDIEEDTTE